MGDEVGGQGLVVQRMVLVEDQHPRAAGGQGQPLRVGGFAGREGVLADKTTPAWAGISATEATSVKAMPRPRSRALTEPCGSSTTSSRRASDGFGPALGIEDRHRLDLAEDLLALRGAGEDELARPCARETGRDLDRRSRTLGARPGQG